MVKIEIKSVKITSFVSDMLGNKDLWDLVDNILEGRFSFYNGAFRGGDISEELLKKIGRVLANRMMEKCKAEIIEERDKDGNLLGWVRHGSIWHEMT